MPLMPSMSCNRAPRMCRSDSLSVSSHSSVTSEPLARNAFGNARAHGVSRRLSGSTTSQEPVGVEVPSVVNGFHSTA